MKTFITPLLIAITFFAYNAQAQSPQDCPFAIPVTQSTYNIPIAYVGAGNDTNELTFGFFCSSVESNDVWYKLSTVDSGTFCFMIFPNNPTDDYDWAVFNITNAVCADIATNPTLGVSCNFTPNLGCGGTTGPNGNISGACGPQNEPTFQVNANETYVINVSHLSAQSGFTIVFCGIFTNAISTVAINQNIQILSDLVKNKVTISSANTFLKNIRIADAMGKVLKDFNLNEHEIALDISSFSKGLYFVSATDEKETICVKKFLKQ